MLKIKTYLIHIRVSKRYFFRQGIRVTEIDKIEKTSYVAIMVAT